MAILKKDIILNSKNMPRHIALIMDGNGRWAKKRGLPRTYGHKVGTQRIIDIINESIDLKIEALTVYAFSTENWKRNNDEIEYIFSLLYEMFDKKMESIMNKNIKVRVLGTLDRLEGKYDLLKQKIEEITNKTKNNTGLMFNVAFNYGSHDEIIRAIKNISKEVKDNSISVEDIDESLLENYLMTKGLPNIDMVVRTSGEVRLSNFLLWQVAYSELIFTNTYWPDFDGYEFRKCIQEYQKRDRKYGNV